MTLKGETGCVGFVFAFIHSFLGVIICDVAYKTKWFNHEEGKFGGRLGWNFEVSMVTAAIGSGLLWVVAMRSIMGKASWIRLKPLYTYVSPIAIWFSTIHVIAFGSIDFYTAFNPQYYKGMPTISFLSTMFSAAILVVHHVMTLFGTKKVCSGDLLWKHSIVNVASIEYNKIAAHVYKLESNFETLGETFHQSSASACNSIQDFEDYLYDMNSGERFESQTAVIVGVQEINRP